MRQKRILIVAPSRKTRGGITAVVKAHEQGVQWKKYRTRWIETHIDRNVFLKLWYFLFSLTQFFFLVPFYDLVHIHVADGISPFRKSFYLTLSRMYGKKVIVHLHSPSPGSLYKGRNKKLYRYLFTACDKVIVLSGQWEEHLNKALGLTKNIRVLYNPIVSFPSEEMMAARVKRNCILFAGTLNQRKGYRDLILAFRKIALAHPDWTVVMAGNGEVEEGRLMADASGLASRVEFTGWVDGGDKEKWFGEASIFCLPSYAEGFPMAVLDAWAYGLPVVCTPVGGILEVLEDGKNGLLFDPGDVDRLAAQLDRLISDASLRESIVEEAHKLSETVFNLKHINEQLAALYEELLGG